MKLSDIVIETSLIACGKSPTGEPQHFEVRGINVEMVSQIIANEDANELEEGFKLVQEIYRKAQAGNENAMDGLGAVLKQLPTLSAKLIATATGEPEEWGKVAKFSLPIQLDALKEIGRLTFDGEDSIKKFVSGLFGMFKSLTSGLQTATDALPSGTKS